MGEFVGWLNDEENAFIKKQFNEYSTGLYLRLKNERGFKEELLKNIGLEPGSKEFNELRSVLDNDEDLKTFANSLVIQTSITDKEGTGRNFTVSDDDFVFDPSKLKHLLVNKIEVTKDGFIPTNDFEESTKEGKEDSIIDTKKDILNSPLDSSKKSEVFDKASEDLNNKVETSSKVIDTVVYEEAGSSINTDLTDEELADLEKIRARRKLKEDTRKAGVDQFNLLKRGATYAAFEAGDMDALNKFVETGDHNTNYRGSDRFYSALERAGLPPDATQEMVQNYLNPQAAIGTGIPIQIQRMSNLGIIPENVDQRTIESKVTKLLDFTSFAESRNRNDQVSSVGNSGFYQFKTNDPSNPDSQQSLETAYNRLKTEGEKIEGFKLPNDLVQLAEDGFVSLKNVSKESQSLLAISNYIEDSAADIETGNLLPSGTGSGYMKAYLESAPGSLEEKQALENLYYNVHHKSRKGITGKDLQMIKNNFNKSYNRIYSK